MDGQQASNPRLAEDLKAYPQAILFSGHSHLNNNDDRSIHQRDFTSVNDGSMSYIEIDHGYQMITESGLANRFESPTAQALFVDVYKDRTEIGPHQHGRHQARHLHRWAVVRRIGTPDAIGQPLSARAGRSS